MHALPSLTGFRLATARASGTLHDVLNEWS